MSHPTHVLRNFLEGASDRSITTSSSPNQTKCYYISIYGFKKLIIIIIIIIIIKLLDHIYTVDKPYI